MKILHVVPTYLPAVRHGGPIRAVHGLARALVDRGHEVVVHTTNLHGDSLLDLPTDRAVDLDGVSVRYFQVSPPRRLARSAAMATELRRSIGSFDAAHLHSLFLWPTRAAARAAERARTPYVVSPRGMLVPELVRRRGTMRKRLWIRFVERRTLARASRLVVTTLLEGDEARAFGFALPPIEVLANGVDPGEAEAARSLDSVAARRDGPPVFVYLGRLSWKKGLESLIEAFALVEGARLVLAGNDEEGLGERLRASAARLGVADRVELAGFVEGEKKQALLDGARALVLPSISENFGNVVLEAWARGVPVIVTPGVGLASEVYACGGGLVAPSDAATLAAALVELRDDGLMARDMGERGRRAVLERFTWPALATRAESIYRAVVDERRGAPR
jgi:glycosyltransferase involved in cell wall biosynthesis